MASCTIPSCHINAANTALIHCDTDGDMASLTGLRNELVRDLEVLDFDDPALVLSLVLPGDAALSRLFFNNLLLSFLVDFGETLKIDFFYLMN